MLCIVLVLLFAGCGKNGDTSKVEIDYGASSVYSKEEIDSAIEIIKKQFASFEGVDYTTRKNVECQQLFSKKLEKNKK